MFAPAEWEIDVPEVEFNFSQVKKNKQKESSAINKTEKASSTKVKKKRNNKFKNAMSITECNTEKNSTQKNVSTENKKSSEILHLSTQTELSEYNNDNNNDRQRLKSKTKRHKNNSNNLINDDLDVTIISNKKKEILNPMDPTEHMLFHNIKDNFKVKENEKKKESSAVNITPGKASSFTKTKEKKDKKLNNTTDTTQNVEKKLSQKNVSIKEMRCSKRRHTSNEAKISQDTDNKSEPQKKKKKTNEKKSSNLMNDELNETIVNKKKDILNPLKPTDIHSYGTAIVKKKKEVFNPVKPTELVSVPPKLNSKKEKIKNMLQTHLRNSIKTSGAALHQRMLERLKGAQFRYLNEKLYVSEGKDAKELFKSDPTSFKVYHDGFKQQVKKWPVNPLDIIIKKISKMPKETKVADLGCGEGTLAKSVPQKVRSFDLVAMSDEVEECDMARTPLLPGEMDVAVYCLALMGTNLKQYLIEANRILKVGGLMKIAEVESRFSDVNEFIKSVECYGFKLKNVDDSRKVFYFFDFKKMRDLGSKKNKLPFITLEPCLYKKR